MISECLFKGFSGSRFIRISNFSWRQSAHFLVVFEMARTALTINYVNVGLSSLLLNFVNLTSKWCLFHLDNSCFGMILSDYNTAFSIHPLIGRYKLVGLYLVLILYTWCWTFFSCISFASDNIFLSTLTWKFLIFYWNMFLLFLLIIVKIFSVQLYLTLTELQLNILCNLLVFGKRLSNSFKKLLATFVMTLLL